MHPAWPSRIPLPGMPREKLAARRPEKAGSLSTRFIPSWPLLIGLIAFIRALAEPRALLNDPDTYLHIAAGRWIVAHLGLPFADPFSHTMTGASWIPGQWLGEVILAMAYAAAGWSGVAVVTAACFGLALGLATYFLARRVSALPGVIAAFAGAALALPHLLARPHVLALPLLVSWSGVLLSRRGDGLAPPCWLLLVIALWANLHASFLFGIGLAGFLAVEAVWAPGPGCSRATECRRWGCFAVGSVVAALLTPIGIEAFLQPLRLMAMPALQASFEEWLPPDFVRFPALELWLLGLVAIAFTCRARLALPRLVLLLALVHMALAHVRHADLLGLVGPLVIADAIGPVLIARLDAIAASPLLRFARRLGAPARWPAVLAVVAFGGIAATPLLMRPLVRADDRATPGAAVAAARQSGFAGPVFNGEAFGGYLAFTGVLSFIDGRIEMYGDRFLAEHVAAEHGDATVLAVLLARYGVGWTLLAPQSGAVAVLDRLAGWRRAYEDAVAVIHVPVESRGR